MSKTAQKPDPELTVTRHFDAPRARVFEAWTSAEHIRQWLCPEGFTIPECTVDFREGGAFDVCMRGPDGTDHWSRGTWVEIAQPERLSFADSLDGPGGKPLFNTLTAVRFDESGSGTLVTVHQRYEVFDPKALEMLAGAEQGWNGTLDKLAAFVRGDDGHSTVHASFTVERFYDTSPRAVFAAWSTAEAKSAWFVAPDGSPADYSLDFRVGGAEINRGTAPNGSIYTYGARYYDIVPDQRIVYCYDMMLGNTRISVSLSAVDFAAADGGTRLTYTEHGAFLDGHDTVAARKGGTNALLDQLGTALAER